MKSLKIPTNADLPAVIRLAKNFHAASPYKTLSFDREKVREFAQSIIDSDKTEKIAILAMEDDKPVGLIAGYTARPLFSKELISYELMWWVEPEYRHLKHGLLLIQAYEDWALRVGCKYVIGATLGEVFPEKMADKYFESNGFTKAEFAYVKEVK